MTWSALTARRLGLPALPPERGKGETQGGPAGSRRVGAPEEGRRTMAERDVHLELTAEQAATLLGVIDGELGEFTSEIANTDNASYRASLDPSPGGDP